MKCNQKNCPFQDSVNFICGFEKQENCKFATFKDDNAKHLKGFIYDSLVYRYIRAREQMAEYEYTKDSKNKHEISYYYELAHRDILKFCQILDEVIGEHE
jgi:hypothetical protein